MLAYSDKLIAEVKKSKFVKYGRDELNRRPVKTAEQRVLGMASLDVDIVGIIPSYLDNRALLPTPPKKKIGY